MDGTVWILWTRLSDGIATSALNSGNILYYMADNIILETARRCRREKVNRFLGGRKLMPLEAHPTSRGCIC